MSKYRRFSTRYLFMYRTQPQQGRSQRHSLLSILCEYCSFSHSRRVFLVLLQYGPVQSTTVADASHRQHMTSQPPDVTALSPSPPADTCRVRLHSCANKSLITSQTRSINVAIEMHIFYVCLLANRRSVCLLDCPRAFFVVSCVA